MSLNPKRALDIMKKTIGNSNQIVESSVSQIPNGYAAAVQDKEEIICITDGPCAFADRLECTVDEYKYGFRIRFASMNNKNSQALRFFLKWTAPSAVTNEVSSFGFTDNFGLLLPEITTILVKTPLKPVLISHLEKAEELATFMGEVAWQAFGAGLKNYGAEYSAAKTEQEVMNALLCGYTSIVIDASEKVKTLAPQEDLSKSFAKLPEEFREALLFSYQNKTFSLNNTEFSYSLAELQQYVLTYGDAIAFLQYIYNSYFKGAPWPVDFIFKLGEQNLPAKAHYLLTNELKRAGINLAALVVNPTTESFPDNLLVAAELRHKLSLTLPNEENVHLFSLIKNTGCKVDLRLPNASSINTAKQILAAKGQEVPADDKKLQQALAEYKEEYLQKMSEQINLFKSLLTA